VAVSDTHLSYSTPEALSNWNAVIDHVALTRPELVIHVGDLSLDGPADPNQLADGRRQLDRLAVAWRAVPGNHDIGDNPTSVPHAESLINSERHARWVETIGADWWSLDLAGWHVVAIDAQLFGSGLAAEDAQWSWLASDLRSRTDDVATLLVTHKPWVAHDAELASAPPYRFIPERARARLMTMFGDDPPALVLSGHVHQYRWIRIDSTEHVWAPSTWAVLPDEIQATVGDKRCGILAIDLHDDGRFSGELVEPPAMRQLTVGRDIPDPYRG
jgi:3',5'-cyclic AMP phosphodiesterase CpdA